MCTFRDADGRRFLKLPKKPTGFARLCLEEDGGAKGAKKNACLNESRGYKELIRLRNAALRLQEAEAAAANIPEMFKGCAQTAKPQRLSKAQIGELKERPEIIPVEVPAVDGHYSFVLNSKRPLTEREDLVVGFDMEAVEKVVKYIRVMGFDAPLAHEREPRRVAFPVAEHVESHLGNEASNQQTY